ncbi:hypothetical protein [Aureimonas psammosilenae]|uniref:hypothetical protein n=1 Tax=Aureimonas psammosilenae TaxID=2495496 RepID=UPI00126132FB|nr:hypothetical protein [Aureimonas psammosilenae]
MPGLREVEDRGRGAAWKRAGSCLVHDESGVADLEVPLDALRKPGEEVDVRLAGLIDMTDGEIAERRMHNRVEAVALSLLNKDAATLVADQ